MGLLPFRPETNQNKFLGFTQKLPKKLNLS